MKIALFALVSLIGAVAATETLEVTVYNERILYHNMKTNIRSRVTLHSIQVR